MLAIWIALAAYLVFLVLCARSLGLWPFDGEGGNDEELSPEPADPFVWSEDDEELLMKQARR